MRQQVWGGHGHGVHPWGEERPWRVSGSRARGRQTCASWGAGGPGGLPSAAPTPMLGLLVLVGVGGGAHLPALPSQTLQSTRSRCSPWPCPWLLGTPLCWVPALAGGEKLQGHHPADLGHPLPPGRLRVSEQHRCFKPGLCRPHHHCLGFPELRQDLQPDLPCEKPHWALVSGCAPGCIRVAPRLSGVPSCILWR